MRRFLFTIALLSGVGLCGAAPIRVLIVDGFSNHDWKLTTALIRGVIEPTGLFEVSVSTTPPTKDSLGGDALCRGADAPGAGPAMAGTV